MSLSLLFYSSMRGFFSVSTEKYKCIGEKIHRFIFRKFVKTCHKPDYSYIEARFQDQVARTTVAVGPNPAWNQELALTFKSLNNDYSPETLNRVKDCLHLHLFDEVTTDLIEDEADKDSKVNFITCFYDS